MLEPDWRECIWEWGFWGGKLRAPPSVPGTTSALQMSPLFCKLEAILSNPLKIAVVAEHRINWVTFSQPLSLIYTPKYYYSVIRNTGMLYNFCEFLKYCISAAIIIQSYLLDCIFVVVIVFAFYSVSCFLTTNCGKSCILNTLLKYFKLKY